MDITNMPKAAHLKQARATPALVNMSLNRHGHELGAPGVLSLLALLVQKYKYWTPAGCTSRVPYTYSLFHSMCSYFLTLLAAPHAAEAASGKKN
jgi:hypothetical protein